MPIYDFIVQYIVPLISSNPSEQAMETLEGMFWFLVSFVIAYFAVYLPYYFIRRVGNLPSLLRKKR